MGFSKIAGILPHIKKSCLCLTALLLLPAAALAGGPVLGAKASGMGTAFVAVVDDPSAIAYNPSGLSNLKGTNVYLGDTVVSIQSTYESPAGEREYTQKRFYYPPHLYVSSDFLGDNIVLGLGIYSPFGIGGRRWGDDGLTRYASTRNEIVTIAVNPCVSWQALPGLSVGAGLIYMSTQSRAEKNTDQSVFGDTDGSMGLKGSGSGLGYNAGVLFKPSDTFRLGFAYRSEIKTDIKGKITLGSIATALRPYFGGDSYESNVDSSFTFPEVWSLGFALKPNERLIIDIDTELVRWSSFDRVHLDIKDEVPLAGFTDSTTKLGWKDVLHIKAGFDYRATERISIRGGYAYVPTPVPAQTLGPDNPDANQHNFSVGLGYRKKRLVIDSFYMVGFFEKRKVENAILSGNYKNLAQYLGLSAGYEF